MLHIKTIIEQSTKNPRKRNSFMKLRVWLLLLSSIFIISMVNAGETIIAPSQNTLFLAHFEKESVADYARGVAQMEKFGTVHQVKGKIGKALGGFSKAQNYVMISPQNNFDANRGSVEMWIKPDFDYNKAPEQYCMFFYCDADDVKTAYKNCAYIFYRQRAHRFSFGWWANGKMALVSSAAQHFKKGDWLHLKCFWGGEADIIAIMVNGKMGEQSKIPGRWANNPRELILGKGKRLHGSRLAHSDIDEFTIKNMFSSELYQTNKNFSVDGKKYFYRPRNRKADPELPSTIRKSMKDCVVFRRSPRMVYPDSIPQKEEFVKRIKLSTTPGERKTTYFSLYGLRDLENVKIQASLLDKNGQALNMEHGIQVKKIRFWPQKSNWTTRLYYIIPELIEKFDKCSVKKNECCTFWLDFKTDSRMPEGRYEGTISINIGNDHRAVNIPLELEILPFKLIEPDNKHWLMYIGRHPEKTFVKQKKMLEQLKSYGISGLILDFAFAPVAGSVFSFQTTNGKISGFQSDYLKNILKIYKKTGMDGPVALWFQFRLEQAIVKALAINYSVDSEEWKKQVKIGLRDGISLIDAFIRKYAPGTKWYFYGKDEPPLDGKIFQRTYWVYKIMKSLKVKTCNTYYIPYKNEEQIKEFIPLLDADISFCPNQKDLNLLAQSGCQFWFLGGGCYPGQEGGLMPNRFLSGFGFYQTKGNAHVSWVWQRIKNDPFNEFKKVPVKYRKEEKPAMITYPALGEDMSGYTSTLQWEGIREGITDYKYLYTLNQYILKAKQNGLQQEALSAKNNLDKILKRIPRVFREEEHKNHFKIGDYYLNPGNFTDMISNECRNRIAEEITKLVRKLRNS